MLFHQIQMVPKFDTKFIDYNRTIPFYDSFVTKIYDEIGWSHCQPNFLLNARAIKELYALKRFRSLFCGKKR